MKTQTGRDQLAPYMKTEKYGMLADTHMHTVFCKHARGRVTEYVATARRRGIPEICFTDHMPAPDGYDPMNRMDMSQFTDYRALIRSEQTSMDPIVNFGIEGDYYEGCEKHLEPWLKAQAFDLVIGSVHYIGGWSFDDPKAIRAWSSVDVPETWRKYFAIVGKLADTGLYDVLGHPDLPKKFGHRAPADQIEAIVSPAFDRIAAAGMAIEINTSGLRKPVAEIYPSPEILRLARERNIPITFGSDSHAPENVGEDFDKALALARSAGYTDYLRIKQRKRTVCPFPAIN